MMYTKEYIDSLDKALQEHNKLKNSFKENKLLSLGLQQEARELQKPITDAIDRLDRVVVQKTVVNSTPQESIEDVEDINITPLNPTIIKC
jgi:chemotaxis regulatin CheY-phosphate phosphatase CheZ